MKKIKYIKRQDSGFKLSYGNSGETSLNLSNEIFDFISKGNLRLGEENDITFRIYKEDCIKAMSFIIMKLPLYKSSSNNSYKVENSLDTFSELYSKISSFFGSNKNVEYRVNLFYRTDGRIYLKGLRVNGFSIRDYLVENYSALQFDDEEDGILNLRILSDIEDKGDNEQAQENINNSVKQIYSAYRPYISALRTKPFMLLAGISGTGKSRIVRKLAQATTTQHYNKEEDRWKNNRPENFELIQVKPNWHNSMDVVGFFSNISKRYEFTPFVEFIVKAWQHKDTPYFLCLDEMNLAPVEEYFAEFLSAIESRSIDENGEYITDPIIKPFNDFGKDACEAMLKHLLGEAHHTESNPLAEQFSEKGLTLPPNLMVMGTVNMDETTFSFSRKVLDRAMSVEMNEVNYDKFLSGESEQFPLLTDFNELLVNRPQQASEVKDDIDSKKVIDYLKAVNDLLEGTPFKLGYRAANEAILYVSASKVFEGTDFSIEKALDEFTLMKILSRIEGDDNRLAVDENDPRVVAIGKELITDLGEDRINLLNCLRTIVRQHIGSKTETEKKINGMYRTLEREHFVSYWA